MKRTLWIAASCVFLLAVARIASASDWTEVGSMKDGTVFVDNESILAKGNLTQAWIMWEMSSEMDTGSVPPRKYRSAKQLQIFDCPTRRLRTTEGMVYSGTRGTGNIVGSYDIGTAFKEVAPGTLFETLLKYVCERAAQKPRLEIAGKSAGTAKPVPDKKPASKEGTAPETRTFAVKQGLKGVNVRSGPATTRPLVAKLNGGDRVEKMLEEGLWLKIRFSVNKSRGEGWLRKDLIESSSPSAATVKSVPDKKSASPEEPSTKTRSVTVKKGLRAVKVRPDPSTSNPPVATRDGGDPLETILESGMWLKVWFIVQGKRVEGWIRKDLVEN